MDAKNVAKEWFTMGDLDLESAKYLQDMEPMPVEIICYHAQQCVEKYLKGFLAFNGARVVRTHDLLILNKECRKFNKEFVKIQEACIELTDYGVHIRYPFHIQIEEYDARRAVKLANEIREFVLSFVRWE